MGGMGGEEIRSDDEQKRNRNLGGVSQRKISGSRGDGG